MAIKPTPDDLSAFLDEVRDVAPIKPRDRIVVPAPKPPPVPVQSLLDDRAALADSLSDNVPDEIAAESGEELVFRRNGIGHDTVRKLRRGHWSIQDNLDLHGLVVDEARALLSDFLHDSVKRGLRCVRIVHGKGYRSANGEPVLKRKVANWLTQRDAVLAYVQAKPADGGSGAVVVLLKGLKREAPGSDAGY